MVSGLWNVQARGLSFFLDACGNGFRCNTFFRACSYVPAISGWGRSFVYILAESFFFPGMHEALGMIGDDCCSTVEAPRSAPCSALQGASRCLISMACKECSVPIPGARQIVLRCAKHSSHVFAQHPKHPGACQQKSPRGTLITFRFFSCHIFSCASSWIHGWSCLNKEFQYVSWKTKTGKGSRPSGAWHDADPAAIRRNSAVSKSPYVDCKSVRFDYAFDTYESSRMHASRLHEKALPFRQSLQTRTSMPQHATTNILWLYFAATLPKHCKGAGQVMHVIVVMIMNNIIYIVFTISIYNYTYTII